ncbi:MAG: hypothetical protein QNJ05_05580 [Woeseiaceae bacterium]|nr:hypothetical protein [Woeseiaceae bacterium]
MIALFRLVLSVAILGLAQAALADTGTPPRPVQGQADLCYQETIDAAAGAAPETLSTVTCARALRQQSLTREDQSVVLYNRGLIERAQGRDDAARRSFERAVALSRKVDMRNLALAQQAHKQGDYAIALQQYRLILESPYAADDVQKYRDQIERIKATAMLSLEQDADIESAALAVSNEG